MSFESTVARIFTQEPNEEHINPCCVGGEEILTELKSEIAAQMNIDENSVEIYQEDWGWALEFVKDDVIYLLGVSNETEREDKESLIVFNPQAFRKVKKFFFSKTIDAAEESQIFSKGVLQTLVKNGYKIN